MQDLRIMQQTIDAFLMVKLLYQIMDKIRYEEVSMSQYLPVSTKVNLSSIVFHSFSCGGDTLSDKISKKLSNHNKKSKSQTLPIYQTSKKVKLGNLKFRMGTLEEE
jgi:predicted nucleotide-binding protein (sugar kinase/HSP70/actin superfamily)